MKLYLEAIRALPEEYIDDGTILCEIGRVEGNDSVVVANPLLPPMQYTTKTGWFNIKFEFEK